MRLKKDPPKANRNNLVGRNLLRVEGEAKVQGQTQYVDDLDTSDALYGATIRSNISRGILKKIHFDQSEIPWDQFVIVTAKDIGDTNSVALILDDQPFLAQEKINHFAEPILLLAHADPYLLRKACKHVSFEFKKLPAVYGIEESLAKQTIVWGKDNIFKELKIEKGDVKNCWKDADFIVEGAYATEAQEQLYIENQGMIAAYSETDGVTVWGSLQCPYYVHKALCRLFNFSKDKVRVIQCDTGGGFGGKEEYPSILAGHAALLARKAGKCVKIIYDRAEDLLATTKRHPSITKHRTAVKKDGTIMGMEIDFYLDGGAYATLSSVVLSRGAIHAAGPYFCPNVRITAKAVATNHPPHGAFRGFGAPQSIFALERHMEKIAKIVGLTAEEIRAKNFLRDGQTTATGQKIKDQVDMQKLMKFALTKAKYHAKIKNFAKQNQKEKFTKRGIGFASFMHGAGFTGSGERMLSSQVNVRFSERHKLQILASSTEIGQGTNTIFTQIACDTLGLPPQMIEIIRPDTNIVPDSGPTVASRTCMIVGNLVKQACENLRQKLFDLRFIKTKHTAKEFAQAALKYSQTVGELFGNAEYRQPPDIFWNDQTYSGEAYATYAWATYVAEVAVDVLTHQVKVENFIAVQEVGTVVHPILAQGQIEGGVIQGLGFALHEKVVWQDGKMANNSLTNYIIPTSMDVPIVQVYFFEKPTHHGPFGAKGIGELPLDGGAPAIANAIENALGIPCDRIPIMPEQLLLLKESRC